MNTNFTILLIVIIVAIVIISMILLLGNIAKVAINKNIEFDNSVEVKIIGGSVKSAIRFKSIDVPNVHTSTVLKGTDKQAKKIRMISKCPLTYHPKKVSK